MNVTKIWKTLREFGNSRRPYRVPLWYRALYPAQLTSKHHKTRRI